MPMSNPTNLTPEENKRRVTALRKRLKENLNIASKVRRIVWGIIFVGCLATYWVSSFPKPLVLTALVYFVQCVVIIGMNLRSRREAPLWQKAFDDNVILPLDLLIYGCRTLFGDPKREAENRLFAALNSSRAAEYPRLSPENKRWLLSLLTDEPPFLPLSILAVIEEYGGEETLIPLKNLIKVGESKPSFMGMPDGNEKVSTAAKRILPVVEARIEAAKRGETLLRPSVAPAEPDTFLRPSTEMPNSEDEAQLLRASLGETEE